MAGALKDFVIQKVLQAIEENATLIREIQSSVEDLEGDLKTFDAYLWKASDDDNLKGDVAVRDVVGKMREVVTKADVSINTYIALRKNHKTKEVATRMLVKLPYWYKVSNAARTIKGVAEEAQKIRQNHAHILQLLQAVPNKGRLVPRKGAGITEKEPVRCFETEAIRLKNRLMPKVIDDMKVISITGTFGVGKTAFARMVYSDIEDQDVFELNHWVSASDEQFDVRQIFIEILSKLRELTNTDHSASVTQLAETLRKELKNKKYFVVIDDISKVEEWESLKDCLPGNSPGSRILVTTQDNLLASRIDSDRDPHKLAELPFEDRWKLLENHVFGKKCPPGPLEILGRQIAQKCKLPLEIVLIAVVLDRDRNPSSWRKVAENPLAEVAALPNIIFNHLGSHLKRCYPYFAAFPKGHEIDAWKLIQLWIAEGFVELAGAGNPEDTAKQYLNELVDMNLVEVLKRRPDGQIKTCRINGFLHELCRREAADSLHLSEIDVSKRQDAVGRGRRNYRRLCVHSAVEKFFGSRKKKSNERITSFISCSSEHLVMDKKMCLAIAKAFPQVKVLEVESLQFAMLPKQISNLNFLKYLAISSSDPVLPSGNLWSLQTLVLKNPTPPQSNVEVKADIWRMPKLKHVRTNCCLKLPPPPPPKKKNKGGGGDDVAASACLETLSTISSKSCTQDILGKMKSLKKLGIRGNLAILLEGSLFEILQKMNFLENLKLLNTGPADGKFQSVPQHSKFLPCLSKVTLSNTRLGWEDISTLRFLHKLEVLKLDNYAFEGAKWELSHVVFENLQYLRIGKTNLASWIAYKTSFPVLKKLIIKECASLDTVPRDFADVESLECIWLLAASRNAVASAEEIKTKKGNKKFELRFY